jgi:DNA-directed RNA polymerase specialized sigma24 family protein
VTDDFDDAVRRAIDLAADDEPWAAIACLQSVDIEAAVLRLTADDVRVRANTRSEREAAVGHALTKLYEYWSRGERVTSVVGFLKVAAVRHARDAARHRAGPDVLLDEPEHDQAPEDDDDPVSARRRAVEIARSILPELGLPSVVGTMSVFLDRVAAGDDASPASIAEFLEVPYSTVTTHLSRGLKRLEQRLQGRDLDALFDTGDDEPDDDYFPED